MAAMLIYALKHSNDFFLKTTGPIWLVLCMENMEHHPILIAIRSDRKHNCNKSGKFGEILRKMSDALTLHD